MVAIMVIKRQLILGLLILLLSGCDGFYGLNLRNELDTSVTTMMRDTKGSVSILDLPPCQDTIIGYSNKPKEDLGLEEVKISRQGVVLHYLNAEQLNRMLAQENRTKGYTAWSITPDGLHLVTRQDSPNCWQGKRRQ
ncbi:hypothetical protein [Thiolinea disciformis]|uniref:hypothetical protein n=1 Tax=Thiolinea disciformis TaxID=125614 RepID=UPI000380C859|nr:hypothetical protein [Thiolinea disciformis]